jgi:hypothetical protein
MILWFRAELVNLMRWRLDNNLGYRTTLPLEFTNTNNNPIYTVIFATSNDTGSKIMTDVFAKHGVDLEKMRLSAKAQRRMRRKFRWRTPRASGRAGPPAGCAWLRRPTGTRGRRRRSCTASRAPAATTRPGPSGTAVARRAGRRSRGRPAPPRRGPVGGRRSR